MVSFGLALSGGGLYGAAHLGVLQGLLDLGLRPSAIAGTSAGGIVAGAFALGISPKKLIDFGSHVARRPLHYFRPATAALLAELLPGHLTPPATGLLDARRFIDALLALAPTAKTTNDFEIDTAITATDLGRKAGLCFVRTPPEHQPLLWHAVENAPLTTALLATMAVPGVFKAVPYDHSLLVDGGLSDILPIDWAALYVKGPVLAVDVHAPEQIDLARTGITKILSLSEAHVMQTVSRLRGGSVTPLTIRPDTEGVGMVEFADFYRLVVKGQEAVARQKEQILKTLQGPA